MIQTNSFITESSACSYVSGVALPHLNASDLSPYSNRAIQVLVPERGNHGVRGTEKTAPVYRWASMSVVETPQIHQYIISDESCLSEFSSTTTSSVSNTPPMETEQDTESIRGVFSVSHHRKILYSEEVEINISKLRRRQPTVQINLERIPDDDE